MAADRALGFSESFFHFAHGLGGYVVAVGARIRGAADEEQIRRGLLRARRRHPLLRAHVVEEKGVLRFREEGTGPIPLRMARMPFDRAMEEEIARPIEGHGAPGLRALLLPGEGDAFDVVLTMNHAVCDGASVISVFHDIIAELGGAPEEPPLDPLPSVEALLSARAPIAKWQGKNEEQDTPLVPRKAPRGERRTRLVFRDLGVEETTRLSARCREEKTSVNGALTAAALVAMQKVAHAGRAHLGVITNVALRDKADPPVGNEHVGNFVSFVQTYHDVSPDTSLWDLARECRDAISARVAAGEPVGRLSAGQLLWWQRGYVRHVAPRLRHGVANALAVSNSGRLALDVPAGYRLESVYAASSQHFIGSSVSLFVWSVGGAMQIVAGCVEPVVSKETLARVADELLGMLRAG